MFLLLLLLLSTTSAQFSGVNHAHKHGRVKRQMMSLGTKWGNGQVNYYFQNTNEDQKRIMWSAMSYISNRTCIRFSENANAGQRLLIHATPGTGCSSAVGAPGSRATMQGQAILGFGSCPFVGNAVHELSHSLGSFHEHNRPDRDDFLTVDQAEVKRTGQQTNMNTQPWAMVKMYTPFEYGSVMMYDVYKYSDEKKIMTPKDPKYERTMGNRRVGFYDIQKINKYYNCQCAKELACDNGGYTNPADCSRCVCPSGFHGKLCNERPCKDSYELAADSKWQSKSIQFSFVNSSDTFAYFHSAFAYINAPDGKTVEIELEQLDNLTCMYGCNVNGVEIKTKEDRKSVSPIICCQDQTFAAETFKSTNNPTIIEMFSKTPNTATVGFRYRYV